MKVELLRTVNHDQTDYQPGDVLDLDDAQAKALVDVGAAKVSETGKPATQDGADAKAKSMLKDAQDKVKQLVADGEEQAKKLVAKAKEDAAKIVADAKAEADKLRSEATSAAEADKAAASNDAQAGDSQPNGQQSLNAVPKRQGNQ